MLRDMSPNVHVPTEQAEALQNLQTELTKAQAHIQHLQHKVAELEEQAASEQTILTRPEFNREVARMLAFDERYGGISSVLYFDFASIDGLSKRYGNPVAAEASRIIAKTLTRNVRRSDIVGRLAADEFGVLLIRCDNDNAWKKGRALAALLLPALEIVDDKKLALDISFGAYTFREEEDAASGIKQAAEAITKADSAPES